MKDDVLHCFSPAEVDPIARSCGFVERASPITGFRFLLTMTTGLLNTPAGTLAQMVAFLASLCGTDVSAQALDGRIHLAAMAFMRCCLEKALAMASRPRSSLNGLMTAFEHIYIIDSTNFDLHPSLREVFRGCGGTASVSSMRIQLVLDYLTGRLYVQIGDTKMCDAPTLQHLVKDHRLDTSGRCLFLSDLGYFKTATFHDIDQQHQFFLSKLMFGVAIHDEHGMKLDLQALLKAAPESFDLPVSVDGRTYRLTGRKLPEAVVNQRLRKAHRSAQCKRSGVVTDAYRLFLQYASFLTNLPATFPIDTLFTLYRVRWQIELIFKTWKSILAIHKIRTARLERLMCEVYGKLIVAALSSRIAAAAEASTDTLIISLHRTLKHLQTVAEQWTRAMMQGTDTLRVFLAEQIRLIVRHCRKHAQKNKPTIETRLRAASIYETPAF